VFQQVTIVGTGLIGGSFGLALRKHGFAGKIVGCDREDVLTKALNLGAIDVAEPDPIVASRDSDLVLLATAVGAVIDLIERLGPVLPRGSLLTDVGSTKAEVLERARAVFGNDSPTRFLAGHPMAGKERGGIEHADGSLIENAVWLLTPQPGQEIRADQCGRFVQLLEQIGAKVIAIPPESHDRLCAWISHLPQMVSTALAATLAEEFGDDLTVREIGGRALREMTRIAASPYSMWRDIALTNTENIQEALHALEQRLGHIRENLRTAELKAEFERANRFHSGDTEARRKL
jgi:prephenate dehydrogenase